MTERAPMVVHVVAAGTPARKLDVLATLCAQSNAAVIHVGSGASAGRLAVPALRVRAPFDVAWLGARGIRQALEKLARPDGREPTILHVWSPTALAWCLPAVAADARLRLLAEAEAGPEIRTLAKRYQSRPDGGTLAFVSPTAIAHRRLIENGVAAEDGVVIRECVDFAALNEARQRNVRADLDLAASDRVILALPPATDDSGTPRVAWAGLLANKVRADARLVIPGVGHEVARAERLVDASRHRHVVRFTRDRHTLPELLGAADLAAYLPDRDAPVTGLIWAMAAARPIVATAVPAVAELLAHGHNAWLCRPNDPKDATRRILQALERGQESVRQAELARSQAFEAFGRQRMIEQYGQAYANLAAGRTVGEQIRDSADGRRAAR